MFKIKNEKLKKGIAVITLIAVIVIVLFSRVESNVTVDEQVIRIPSLWVPNVPIDDIETVTLIEMSMAEIGPGTRRFGSNVPGALRGHFSSGVLYVAPSSAPTIQIIRADGNSNVYISYTNPAETRLLFEEIHQYWAN